MRVAETRHTSTVVPIRRNAGSASSAISGSGPGSSPTHTQTRPSRSARRGGSRGGPVADVACRTGRGDRRAAAAGGERPAVVRASAALRRAACRRQRCLAMRATVGDRDDGPGGIAPQPRARPSSVTVSGSVRRPRSWATAYQREPAGSRRSMPARRTEGCGWSDHQSRVPLPAHPCARAKRCLRFEWSDQVCHSLERPHGPGRRPADVGAHAHRPAGARHRGDARLLPALHDARGHPRARRRRDRAAHGVAGQPGRPHRRPATTSGSRPPRSSSC